MSGSGSVQNGVCLVGGGPVDSALLRRVARGLRVFAADGGADHLIAADLVPEAVIGDLDSLSDQARRRFAQQLVHIAEQDSTDFEKALRRIGTDAGAVTALGFTGGRLDHTLSALNVLARLRATYVVVLDAQDASFLAGDGTVALHLPVGCRVSLMPLGAARVSTTGLRWDLRDAQMALSGMTSPSNAAASDRVTITAAGPVLVTLPQDHYAQALAASSSAR